MSRSYNMYVTVRIPTDINTDDIMDVIFEAMEDVWPFEDCHGTPCVEQEGMTEMSMAADHYLYAGETEEEFAERLINTIWVHAKKYVHVVVRATCLEHIPFEEYEKGEEAYKDYCRAEGIANADI